MNNVDLAVIALLALSAWLAFMRGFVKEVLGIFAWVGAGIIASWAHPLVVGRFGGMIANPDIASPVAYGVVFLIALVFLSVISGMIGSMVKESALSGLDRTLGMVFGLVKGVVLLCVAYLMVSLVQPPDHWPPMVQQARTLDYFRQGAKVLMDFAPEEYRPTAIAAPPPPSGDAKPGDFLRAMPLGRNITHQ